MRACAFFIALALAAPAIACPTRADLEASGVKVDYDDDSRSIFTVARRDVILEETYFDEAGTDGFWLEALFGLYPLAYGGLDGQGRIADDIEYLRYPGLMARPAPEYNWSGTPRSLDDKQQDLERSVKTFNLGSVEEVVIGGCRYEAWPGDERSEIENGEDIVTFNFLPALGIAVLTGEGDTIDGMTPLTATSITIAAD